MDMKINKVYFNTEDNLNLVGLLHMPDDVTPITVVVTTHGFTSNCLTYRDDVIAKILTDNDIAYFTYNNRGHDILNTNGTDENKLQGSAAENITDAYYDIKAAIEAMLSKKFKKIILQGHSLGCTKTVYAYNKLLDENSKLVDSIYGISLLSMVDLPNYLKAFLGNEFNKVVNYLKSFSKKGSDDAIVEVSNKFPPFRPRTVLGYLKNSEIDFFRYSDETYNFEILNKIKVPLFMRWGNVNELISIDAKDLVKILNEKITNSKKDISYIKNANHGYKDKEKDLAKEILKWITVNYLNV